MIAEATPPVSRRPRSKTRDLRYAIFIRASPERVYRALTSATELCRWWLQGAETDARSTGRFRMVWPRLKRPGASNGHARFPDCVALGDVEGHFVDLEPGRKVAWLWSLPRRSSLPPLSSFFIERKGRGSVVTLLHAGFSSRPAADRVWRGSAEGWEDCLAKLKLYLETGRTCKTEALTLSRKVRRRV